MENTELSNDGTCKPKGYKRKVDMGGRVRDKQFKVNITEKEKQMIEKRISKSGLTKQNYVINALLGVPVLPKAGIEELKKMNKSITDIYLIMRNEYDAALKSGNVEDVLLVHGQIEEVMKIWECLRQLIQSSEAIPNHCAN